MRRKSKKAAIVSIAVAAVLVVVLLIAGTVLRMHSRNLGFIQAFASFVKDTFLAGF